MWHDPIYRILQKNPQKYNRAVNKLSKVAQYKSNSCVSKYQQLTSQK